MKMFRVLILFAIILIAFGCDDKSPTENDPDPGEAPNPPTNPNPQSGATNISINTTLSWSCSDPNGDQLTYDVYLGTTTTPILVSTDLTISSFVPETLLEETMYYWYVEATDTDENTTSGLLWSFTTLTGGTGTVTDIDGNVYQTIIIGDQEWIMENLKVTHYRNGDQIPNVTDNSTWAGLSTGAYCVYDNMPANADTYGNLYNFYAVDDIRGLAPAGWHIPTDDEWQILAEFLGGSSVAGGKMKSTGTIQGGDGLWLEPNTGATNESGFTALPGGYRGLNNGTFEAMIYYGNLWYSTESNSDYAWALLLSGGTTSVYRNPSFSKRDGLSVRCVRD